MDRILSREFISHAPEDTVRIGAGLGALLKGGEVIELASDIGGGKTTFVKGMAKGIGTNDQVMSPTFTISREYEAADVALHHFDFYRLDNPGLVRAELSESIADPKISVVIEWGNIVTDVLPPDRLRVKITASNELTRALLFEAFGRRHKRLLERLQ